MPLVSRKGINDFIFTAKLNRPKVYHSVRRTAGKAVGGERHTLQQTKSPDGLFAKIGTINFIRTIH